MSWENDLQTNPFSPINTKELPHDYRYRLNLDNRTEVILLDKSNNLYWDFIDVKALFDEFLLADNIDDLPNNIKIEKYCLNSDERATEIILEFDKKDYFRKTLRYFQLANSPLTQTEDELLEMLDIKNDITTLDYCTNFPK